MLTKDYIMRMINVLTNALARVLFHKKTRNYAEAFDEIERVTKELFGLDKKFLQNLSDSQLIQLVSTSETLIAPNCYTLGCLFKEEAELYRLQNDRANCIELNERSFNLFIAGLKNSNVPIEPDHLNKIKLVADAIENEVIGIETEANLYFYYEFSCRYDKAEDLIFDLIDYDSGYVPEGIAFYERLLKKSDADLIYGNLPREEVVEGLSSLKEKLN